jgi:hypothetical protein
MFWPVVFESRRRSQTSCRRWGPKTSTWERERDGDWTLVKVTAKAAITVGVLAVLLPLWFFWGSIENQRPLCYPHGFTVEVRNRGVCLRRDEYRWEHVTETVCRGGDEPVDESATLVWFSVCARGRKAFCVNQDTPGFDELVQLVNAMTFHLDYVWNQPGGISGDRYFSYPRAGGEIGQGAPPAGDATISLKPPVA